MGPAPARQVGQESIGAGMMQARGNENTTALLFGQGKASQHPGGATWSPSEKRGVVSCQQGRLDALGHGDSPSEEFRVKDIGGSLFQGLSRDPSELSDKAVDSAAATIKSGH